MKPAQTIQLTPGKRVLFLTKDPELIRKQLRGELDLQMKDLQVEDLLDDINTDAMTPAWVCFSHKPEDIAEDAYAGLIIDGKRLFEHDALINGNFEVIVSGYRKGVGSSRETATQCEVWSGIRIAVAASFAPIHAGNNINQGLLMADHAMLLRLQAGEGIPIDEFCKGRDAITQLIIREGGLFPFAKAVARGEIQVPVPDTPERPMTMGEKILARHVLRGGRESGVGGRSNTGDRESGVGSGSKTEFSRADVPQPESGSVAVGSDSRHATPGSRGSSDTRYPTPDTRETYVQPGDAIVVEVDGGYTHEFTTAQVHYFLEQEYGPDYAIKNPQKFAVFEDHLIYADDVARMRPFMGKIQTLRDLQRAFQQHTGCRDFSAVDNISPGICHEVAREYIIDPGDFIQATDSHTCMGGVNNALAWGVGATEYANLVHSGFTQVEVSESIRFELVGNLRENVTAKDVMLYILLNYAKPQMTLDRIMEFTGPGLRSLSLDERATLANMATECAARTAIIEADEKTFAWIAAMRPDADIEALRARAVAPDPDAVYAGGVHTIDLSEIRPMVAHPGDPDHGVPSDPTNGAFVDQVTDVKIDIAYAGSCTAGKVDDFLFYHQVAKEAVDAGLKVADGVKFYIQFGSQAVETFARENGLLDTFERAGAIVLNPGCGACIGCGPGVSEDSDQVTISAINRNYKGRSGPGKLWLASPLTVAASAFTGHVTAYTPGMFAKQLVEA